MLVAQGLGFGMLHVTFQCRTQSIQKSCYSIILLEWSPGVGAWVCIQLLLVALGVYKVQLGGEFQMNSKSSVRKYSEEEEQPCLGANDGVGPRNTQGNWSKRKGSKNAQGEGNTRLRTWHVVY